MSEAKPSGLERPDADRPSQDAGQDAPRRTPLSFLRPSGAAVARSPMERQALAAGARFEVRDGWSVAVSYGEDAQDAPVWWADVSHLAKIEVVGPHELVLGQAVRANRSWRCPVTRDRTLVVGDRDAGGIDLTSSLAALVIGGPKARELFARFCALDLRDRSTPVGAFRPGSVARTPGYVLREDDDRFLMLFGWALGEYMWTVVADAAESLGGRPIGVDALDREAAHA
jgi:heterotetrameric sarcosine oxidase gamma subunit